MWLLQVVEMEKELEPMKEKLQSDRRSTEKYDEKVEEWKVSEHSVLVSLKHMCIYIFLFLKSAVLTNER